ncbi:MAG: carbon monoxide dehydrogenase [Desulfurococcales archaeon ex4484_58]|nr:MAG: carbon monoxide dehydrogenase [Desulfurococcales archaeon ex4484_58]
MFYVLPRFNYYRPNSLDEVLKLINELENYKILAGGTDLLIDMRIKRYTPRNIVDINRINELQYIREDNEYIRIGSLTRLQDIIESNIIREKLPLLYNAVYNMASWQIRNRATIGGNLCNASPAADTAPPLMVYNAKLVVSSINGSREISILDFFKGPRETDLRNNELLVEIKIPKPHIHGYSYRKIGRRNAFTLSIVAIATYVEIENNIFRDVRIALNSVAPKPVRAWSVEEYLKNKRIDREEIYKASELVVKDISPISDVRASADYRRKLSIILIRETLFEASKITG